MYKAQVCVLAKVNLTSNLSGLQVQPHRVDRQYYVSGSSLKMPGKYEVDDEDMMRLRQLVLARNNSGRNVALSGPR